MCMCMCVRDACVSVCISTFFKSSHNPTAFTDSLDIWHINQNVTKINTVFSKVFWDAPLLLLNNRIIDVYVFLG